MNNRFLMSVAAAALIAGSGLSHAQGVGDRETPGAGGAAHSAPAATPSKGSPSADRAAPAEHAAPVNRDEATDTNKRPDAGSEMKSTQSDDKVKRDDSGKHASDTTRDNAPKSNAQANDAKPDGMKGDKGMKAEGAPNGNAGVNKTAADTRSGTTTGQAGAGAKMNSEQRTKITTVIKQQKIESVTNVNFAISVGTRVPSDVTFHPLPAEIITIYPDWRGYDFILVRDQILVIDPSSHEIVAVIDA